MKKLVLALAFGLLGTSAMATSAMAQDKTVDLKISIWLPPAHPLVPATKAWADDIAKASGGTIKTAIFPSEQLGKAFDHYDMARDGIADMTYVNPGYQPGRFPMIAVGQMPFTFADADKGTAALDTWYRKYAAQEMKDTHFCFAFIHDPGAYHGRKKVVLPEDIKGMKIRPAQSTIGQMVTMLGGTNVQASAPEARDVLERGVADGIFFPWGSMFLFGLDKVTKYYMDVPLYSTVFTYSMNKAKYDAMSPAQKKVIDEPLHHRMGGEGRLAVGRLRGGRPRQDEGARRPRGLFADARAAEGVEDRDRAAAQAVGRRGHQGRRRSRRALQGVPGQHRQERRRSVTVPSGADARTLVKRSVMDRIIDTIEAIAAVFVGLVAADIFISVLLRRFFSVQIPDAYDFGSMLLGILIFWGIAATSYRGTHITVDLVWAQAGPRWKRAIDIFATWCCCSSSRCRPTRCSTRWRRPSGTTC